MSLFSSKTILLISPEPWDHIFVSKHHYAIHLARRGNRVFFLNPPKKGHLLKVIRTEYENLNVIDYDGFLPGLRFLPAPVRRFFIRRKFHQLERLIGTAIDIIWSFDNSVFFDFHALPGRVLKVSHIVDLNQDFQSDRAARTADYCFYTSRYIGDKLKKVNDHSCFVQHGYAEPGKSESLNLPGKDFKIKAGYAGNLDIGYIDWAILEEVIENHPKVEFYFAGTCKERARIRWFNSTANVFYLGTLQKKQLSSFYDQMDMLLLAYLADQYREQLANPHKMMEYLASGKPIVATFTQEYAQLNDLICMSKTNADWPGLFQQVVENLDQFRHPEKVRMRKAYALDNTYDKQIDRIGGIIDVALRK